MIRHLVMWKYAENIGEKEIEALLPRLKKAADDMNGNIDGLIFAELLKNVNPNERHDLALYCEFSDFEAVKRYQTDPVHLKFKEVLAGNVCDRVCIDCEKV